VFGRVKARSADGLIIIEKIKNFGKDLPLMSLMCFIVQIYVKVFSYPNIGLMKRAKKNVKNHSLSNIRFEQLVSRQQLTFGELERMKGSPLECKLALSSWFSAEDKVSLPAINTILCSEADNIAMLLK